MTKQESARRVGKRGRIKKLFAVSATALLVSAALAVPALALPTGPGIREGKNISVFHNLDFVAAFGYQVGERLTVDVYRGPHRIATAFGPAAEGSGLEVNHGPEGPAAQGDCWENHTPDILPGDRIVVTDSSGATDEVLVDDISISGEPREDLSTEDPTDVILEGRAAYADGTPIPIAQLDSGELRHDNPRFRATPNVIERIPGTADGWRAVYKYPYKIVQVRDTLTPEQKKQAILNGDHAMGYGHVEPLPPETQLVEGIGGGGPALGCESAPKLANAVTTSDDAIVNLASEGLDLSGIAMETVSSVSVTLSDEDPDTADVTVEATGLTAGSGEKAWSAQFTREQVEGLSDGMLTAAGTYTLSEGGTTTGATRSIQKDTVAPEPVTASPAAGTYDAPRSVALNAEEGARIYYTTDGSEPTEQSAPYSGPIRVASSQTIKAIAADGAGNANNAASFEFVIRKKSFVALRMSQNDLRLGKVRPISGVVRPAHQGVVKLTVRRNGEQVLVRSLRLDDSSAYKFAYNPRSVGRYSVNVRFAGDADHKASAQTKSFKVIGR